MVKKLMLTMQRVWMVLVSAGCAVSQISCDCNCDYCDCGHDGDERPSWYTDLGEYEGLR